MLKQDEAQIFFARNRYGSMFSRAIQNEGVKIVDHIVSPEQGELLVDLSCKTKLIYPYIGDLLLAGEKKIILEEDHAIVLPIDPNPLFVRNIYEKDAINFFEIILPDSFSSSDFQILNFATPDINLQSISEQIWLGKYQARQDELIQFDTRTTQLFVYIFSGVFEVQNRLLEANDSLILKNLAELEFEALSNDGIIFILKY